MTAVNFREHRYVTRTPEFSLEETMKRFLSYAGIHTYKFDSLYDPNAVTWQGTPSIVTQTSTLIEIQGTSGWEWAYADFVVPANHMVSYSTSETDHGCLLAYQDATGDQAGYLVLVNDTAISIEKITNDVNNSVFYVPRIATTGTDYTFVFRQYNFSDDKNQVWNFITVYNGSTEIATYGDIFGAARSNLVVGLACFGTEITSYNNFTVREFCETAEWGTADPGESPMSGLQRVLEGRYIRFWLRATGEFRAWRPKAQALSHALDGNGDYRTLSEVADFTSVATHIRMVGAYLWAEYLSTDGIEIYGYRFAEDDNPMLFTEDECYEEAVKQYKRRLEAALTATVAIQNKPFLEIDDKVSVDGVEYLVSGISFNIGPGSIVGQLTLRKSVW